MAKKKSTALTKEQLLEENKLLSEKLEELSRKNSKKSDSGRFKKSIKGFSITLLVIVATLSFIALNMSFWVKRTITDTDQFVATAQPLLSEPAVTENISTKLTNELFSNVDIEQRLQESLPENIQFLAGPLSSQMESFTKSQINKALQSDEAQKIWGEILRTTQSTIIAYLNNESNTGEITINSLYAFANNNLENSQISFLLNKNIPPKIGNIQLADIEAVPQAQTYLKYIESAPQILTLLFIISVVIIILLANNKRKVSLVIVSVLLITSILMITVVTLGEDQVSKIAKPENKDAAVAIYSTFTKSMYSQIQGLIWLLGSILVVFLVTSKSKIMTSVKTNFRKLLDTIGTKILPQFESPHVLLLIEKNRFLLEIALATGCFIGFGLRVPPTKQGIINSIISASVVVLIVEIAASVARTRPSKTNK
jgi:hypothetical protein